jgi:hypothetical protein
MATRIYDCFTFFNELELLEVRFKELYHTVDYFVLGESNLTFQGQPKELVFAKNKDRFSKYLDKIIHIVVDDMPEGDAWARELHQRNALRRGFFAADPNDVIIISDADEIISENAIRKLKQFEDPSFFLLEMPMYQYFLNLRAAEIWDRPFAFSRSLLDRVGDLNRVRGNPKLVLREFEDCGHVVQAAGWHFTFLGGVERIREKLNAYSHTGGTYAKLLAPGGAERQVETGTVIGGGRIASYVTIDETYPSAIRDQIEYFRKLGFVKDAQDRVKDLERAISQSMHAAQSAEATLRNVLGQVGAILERGANALQPYIKYTHRAEAEGRQNLLQGSKTFSNGWANGTQAHYPKKTNDIPYVVINHDVLKHTRHRQAPQGDNNMGWWNINFIRSEVVYTASCWIWIPESFSGSRVAMYAEGMQWIGGHSAADLLVRDQWQRIFVTAAGKANSSVANIVLRMDALDGNFVYSTCWQLETGERPSPYMTPQ